MPRLKNPTCQFCGRKLHPKGLKNHERYCLKNTKADDTSKVVAPVASGDVPVNSIRLNHLCDNIWQSLSIADRVLAISSLTFDPSNPDGL